MGGSKGVVNLIDGLFGDYVVLTVRLEAIEARQGKQAESGMFSTHSTMYPRASE